VQHSNPSSPPHRTASTVSSHSMHNGADTTTLHHRPDSARMAGSHRTELHAGCRFGGLRPGGRPNGVGETAPSSNLQPPRTVALHLLASPALDPSRLAFPCNRTLRRSAAGLGWTHDDASRSHAQRAGRESHQVGALCLACPLVSRLSPLVSRAARGLPPVGFPRRISSAASASC
jgi:hypothetical protein